MTQQDYYKPKDNLKAKLEAIQLPKNANYYQNNNVSDEEDQIRFTIGELKENSTIIKHNKYTLKEDNEQQLLQSNWGDLSLQSNINKKEIPKIDSKIQFKPTTKPRKPKPKQRRNTQKKQINIDDQIGQVAEWAEKGTKQHKNKDDESDIQQQSPADQNSNFQEIRKRINDKLSKGNQRKQPIGLKAKAEQLRLKKQKQKQQKTQQNLIYATKNKTIQQMQEQQQDDPWEQINKQTLKEKEKQKQLSKNLNYQNVVKHFINIPIKEDISDEIPPEEDGGCLAAMCACFYQSKPNLSIAQTQSIGLSKIQLGNSQEQLFILKQIWTNITHQKFNRYGSHWNKIGFQGRDPATDLRSTGVLSLIQWMIFLHYHEKFYDKAYKLSAQVEIPLALIQIKITSKIIQITKTRKIHSKTWDELQSYYNSFVYSFFNTVLHKQIADDNIGDIIDSNIEVMSKNTSKTLRQYIKWKQVKQ